MYTVELTHAAMPPQEPPVGPDGGTLVGEEEEGAELEAAPAQALTVRIRIRSLERRSCYEFSFRNRSTYWRSIRR